MADQLSGVNPEPFTKRSPEVVLGAQRLAQLERRAAFHGKAGLRPSLAQVDLLRHGADPLSVAAQHAAHRRDTFLMKGVKSAFAAKQMGHSRQVFDSTYARWIDGDSDDAEMAKPEVSSPVLPQAGEVG